ncbi:capsular biosynthesis protein [Methylibium sp.]|uniref:capsular biosynthesis protein n=1 Tax=Methylibium sp. TaxID=2067992 RepID=UPI001852E81B|nr:capsular biosynthesis protein [Methylibium sp.]MBA3588114.1 capsular biosynthesis protein [Methylibium sp.]
MNQLLALTPRRLKLLIIALPLLLATLYYALLAADRYVSESIVTVRQASQDSAGSVPGVAMLLGGVNPPSRDDTLYLRQFIHSLALLNRLDAELDLRGHFEAETADPLYRLYDGVSQEWFLDYYRSRVEVTFDDIAGLLTVRAQGFEPAFAQALNAAILKESERFVNDFSQRMAREQMGFAENELKGAAARLQQAKSQVLAFQTKNKLLDPLTQAEASSALTAKLQSEQAQQEAELRNARTFLNDSSYQIKALRSQLEATRSQLDIERLRATSGRTGERLNRLAADFQELILQAGFAEDAYKLSLAAVENARIEASRKLKSLVVIEPPSLPETARYPRRIYNLVTLAVICLLLYGITRLVIATIREHQD